MVGKIWSKTWPALVFAAAVVLIGYGGFYAWHWLTDRDGQIVVNSPTIYTRQRLVNDRLGQAEWLRRQLRATEEKDEHFRSIDQVQRTIVTRTVSADNNISTTSPAEDTPPPAKDSSQKQQPAKVPDDAGMSPQLGDNVDVAPTTATLFRAKNSYRDEVRSEMMETQLDDRHDILGNTIYRLAFDATVIPGNLRKSIAVIQVTIGHHPGGDNDGADAFVAHVTPPPLSSTDGTGNRDYKKFQLLYEHDYQELYDDWARDMQRLVSNLIDSMANSLARKLPAYSPPRVPADDFVAGRICEFMLGKIGLSPAIDQKCSSAEYSDRDRNEVAVANKNLAAASALIQSYDAKYLDHEIASNKQRLRNELKDVVRGSDFNGMYEIVTRYCMEHQTPRFPLSVLNLGRNPAENTRKTSAADADSQSPEYDCPAYDSPAERLLAEISLYNDLLDYEAGGVPQIDTDDAKAPAKDWMDNLCRVRPASDICGGSGDKGAHDPALDQVQERLSWTRCFAADILRANLNEFKPIDTDWPKQIGNFLTLQIIGRGQNNCQLLVDAHSGDGDLAGIGNAEVTRKKALHDLMYFLNADTETFSYSVTPKTLSENISSSSEIHDAYEMLLHFNSKTLPVDVNSFTKALDDKSRQERAIVEHPVIVGFGSSDSEMEHLTHRNRKENTFEASAFRTTAFGWVILPAIVDGDLQQGDSQHSLTAVVSVPDWWRSAELQIDTCWLTRSKLFSAMQTGTSNSRICGDESTQSRLTVIRLPGSPHELTRKLGIQVVQEPHVDNSADSPQILNIYEPGSLLLSGLRLWRSTEVTLGTQLADSIIVLPNMEGIIATFNCVLPQNGSTVDRSTPGVTKLLNVPVKVWTSEGVSEVRLVDLWGTEDRQNTPPSPGGSSSGGRAKSPTNESPMMEHNSADKKIAQNSDDQKNKSPRQECFEKSPRWLPPY